MRKLQSCTSDLFHIQFTLFLPYSGSKAVGNISDKSNCLAQSENVDIAPSVVASATTWTAPWKSWPRHFKRPLMFRCQEALSRFSEGDVALHPSGLRTKASSAANEGPHQGSLEASPYLETPREDRLRRFESSITAQSADGTAMPW